MAPDTAYQLVGYLASVLIALSMVMNSLLRLRLVNLFGASTMAVYGILIDAYPITVLNSFIVLVDCFYLFRIYHREEFFSLLEVKPGSAYLRYFIDFNSADIDRFIPGFSYRPADDHLAFFVLRDTVPAGLLIAEPRQGEARVLLDYVASGYRDLKVGSFIFGSHRKVFRDRGVRRLLSPPGTKVHQTYLKRMGFTPETAEDGGGIMYALDLESPPAGQVERGG